jgi:transposase
MSGNFRPYDRDTLMLMPASLQDWLPETHLARFVESVIERLDVGLLRAAYAGRGKAAYAPEMLLALLFYGYATGVMSSRRIEQACYDSVPFRYLSGNTSPDHVTISEFRRRFLPEMKKYFVQILLIASQTGMLRLGTVSLDGTKMHASASKHQATSLKRARAERGRLEAEVQRLLARAELADTEPAPEDGMNVPKELTLRETRIAAIDAAIAQIEERECERIAGEEAEVESGLRQGNDCDLTIRQSAQINFTDPDSRIMPQAGGGFEQAYNAQAAVDIGSGLIVYTAVSQRPNDVRLLEDAVDELAGLCATLGRVDALLADAGYCSERNARHCEAMGITPYLAMGRLRHGPNLERFALPGVLPRIPNVMQRMAYRLKTKEGRARYAQRQSTIEPTFGNIKSILGFRQFLLRSIEKVSAEWSLVCLAFNLKRMHRITMSKIGNKGELRPCSALLRGLTTLFGRLPGLRAGIPCLLDTHACPFAVLAS